MEDAPAEETARRHKPDPRSIEAGRFAGRIETAVLAVGSLFGLAIADVARGWPNAVTLAWAAAWVVGGVALAVFHELWPRRIWEATSWRQGELGLEIRKGVVFRREITVPFRRVQHTDVTQGPILRRFGLATLVVHTAGREAAAVTLEGLDRDVAARLRDALLARREARDDGV